MMSVSSFYRFCERRIVRRCGKVILWTPLEEGEISDDRILYNMGVLRIAWKKNLEDDPEELMSGYRLAVCSPEDRVNNTGSESIKNEVEMVGVSEVSLDNLENTELIDEENMPNDLLTLSVSELDEEEFADQPLSIVSSPDDDPSFEYLNFFQS
ncbi:hypothetical protein Tco_0607101 [Tanacetum coccineum]